MNGVFNDVVIFSEIANVYEGMFFKWGELKFMGFCYLY